MELLFPEVDTGTEHVCGGGSVYKYMKKKIFKKK